jgi:hypothetical protein
MGTHLFFCLHIVCEKMRPLGVPLCAVQRCRSSVGDDECRRHGIIKPEEAEGSKPAWQNIPTNIFGRQSDTLKAGDGHAPKRVRERTFGARCGARNRAERVVESM